MSSLWGRVRVGCPQTGCVTLMPASLPQFLGIGVQKGGTTTLQRLLEQHPGAFLPQTKELHFFTLHYALGEAWYERQFADADADRLCGEITPYYIFHPEAPRRISTLLPDVKLIVLLRDPVERTLSQYFHSLRLGLEVLPLEQALDAEPDRLMGADQLLVRDDARHKSHQEHSYLSRSRYEQQLSRWQSHFGLDQLLVLRSEDLFVTPHKLWPRLLDFLNLDYFPLPVIGRQANAGMGEAAKVDPKLRARLREQLEPTYAWVADSYDISWPPSP